MGQNATSSVGASVAQNYVLETHFSNVIRCTTIRPL